MVEREEILRNAEMRFASLEQKSRLEDMGIWCEDVLDFAMYFYIPTGDGREIAVTRSWMERPELVVEHIAEGYRERVGLTQYELMDGAIANASRAEWEVAGLADVLEKTMAMAGIGAVGMERLRSVNAYVILRKNSADGAVALLIHNVLERAARKLGGKKMYVLPASTHELIAVGEDFGDAAELGEVVREINDAVVAPEDRLSYSVYVYGSGCGLRPAWTRGRLETA